jgi:surface antigen
MRRLIALIGMLALLAACAAPMGPKEGTGTLLGAGTGALLGAQVGSGTGRLVATAAGTLLGALAGQDIGRSLDSADQAYAVSTAQAALERSRTNQPATWVNPDSGANGTVTPTRTYQAADGRYCREFTQTVTIEGQLQKAYGTACRQPDGTWQLVSGQPQAPPRQVVIRQRVVPVYPPATYYPPAWYGGYYYPYYSYYPYYPDLFWPFSFSFSWVHHSGGHGGWGGGHRSWGGGHRSWGGGGHDRWHGGGHRR